VDRRAVAVRRPIATMLRAKVRVPARLAMLHQRRAALPPRVGP
jgi:hypothetical protein